MEIKNFTITKRDGSKDQFSLGSTVLTALPT